MTLIGGLQKNIMKNLLTIYPIQSCNLKCPECPMKKWTYPVKDELNKLNNNILIPWVKKWTNPDDWMIEISGGEPGMYPEIEELVTELSDLGYHGLIKTNGTLVLIIHLNISTCFSS